MRILSICVVARNEEAFLPHLLNDIRKQEYPHGYTEVVLVDSMSTDRTKGIMLDFQHTAEDFYSVCVLDNPGIIQAAGWNTAITHAAGDVIARIDAHTMLPPGYSKKVMTEIELGEYVVGGRRPCLIENDTAWGRLLLQTENSLFGSSINKSRRSDKKEYVKTMFHAAYRKEVFEKAGLFNEQLLRTEDNEMHYRIRQKGYRLCYNPEIVSYQYARGSFVKMLKQKCSNGYWIGKTIKYCPGCISLYHLVPFAFVLGIILTASIGFLVSWIPAVLMWILYAVFAAGSTVSAALNSKKRTPLYLLMPFLFLLLHVGYGAGTLTGLLDMRKLRRV